MKHLKPYHESYKIICDLIEDYLTELNDDGYRTQVEDSLSGLIYIRIFRKEKILLRTGDKGEFHQLNPVIQSIVKRLGPGWKFYMSSDTAYNSDGEYYRVVLINDNGLVQPVSLNESIQRSISVRSSNAKLPWPTS